MEPIAIGTARQLSTDHPLSILLRPHFNFMLTNNKLGQEKLINNGGTVDKLLAGTIEESLKVVKVACKGWDINKFAFPKEIKNRNMDKIPHYPYRDDGMLVWKAIHTFVTDYLNYFYPTITDITNDPELQAWASELSDQTNAGGKVNGMPSQINDVEKLIDIVTTVIFTCGPLHSAVNYPQYEYMAFAANMPLAAYQDSIDVKEPITNEKILALLPPYQKTAEQLQVLFFLTAYRYDRLGHYDKAFKELYNEKVEDTFAQHPRIIEILKEFQQELIIVEQKIDANNLYRVVPYPYLKPSLILNSISI
jgi:arachidonate 15-lipoxygenase